MRGVIAGLMALAVLAACRAPEPAAAPGLRRAGAMISSAVLFDPARFGGRWVVA
ncbi:MAG: hypothetical protein IE922_15575, partial [Sphingomonadales bacterium]|nr:hypothetical protein [Sphingomonadales bacterium]